MNTGSVFCTCEACQACQHCFVHESHIIPWPYQEAGEHPDSSIFHCYGLRIYIDEDVHSWGLLLTISSPTIEELMLLQSTKRKNILHLPQASFRVIWHEMNYEFNLNNISIMSHSVNTDFKFKNDLFNSSRHLIRREVKAYYWLHQV